MIADEIRAELYGGPRDGEDVPLDLEPPEPGARPEPPEMLSQPDEPPMLILRISTHPSMLNRQAVGIAVYELVRTDGAYPDWKINERGRLVYAYVHSIRRRDVHR